MENANECLKNSTSFGNLKQKDEFSIKELEQILNINSNTITEYSNQFKDVLSKQDNFNQKDLQTLIMIQSLKKSGLNLSQITTKISEYHQLLKQTLDGTSENIIKSLESYPQASGLKRPRFKGTKYRHFL